MDHRGDDPRSALCNNDINPVAADQFSRSPARLRPASLNMSAISRLQAFGQSVWLDVSSEGVTDLELLRQLIEEDGISGMVCGRIHVVSNDKRGKSPVAEHAAALLPRPGNELATERQITSRDVQDIADLFHSRYALTAGHDGLVDVELPPDVLRDPKQMVEAARRLWTAIGRRNILVSIPGSEANVPAIRDLVTAGVNIRVTSIYTDEHYCEAFDAYCAGLEARVAKGYPIWHVAFVASFAVAALDRQIDAALQSLRPPASRRAASVNSLAGQGGIACATVIHRRGLMHAACERFASLAKQGAQPPRLMWELGSDATVRGVTKYVEPLVRVGTVCSMPLAAIESYRGHDVSGQDRNPILLELEFVSAMNIVIRLQKAGVDIEAIARQLQAAADIRHQPPPMRDRFDAQDDRGRHPGVRKPPCQYGMRLSMSF